VTSFFRHEYDLDYDLNLIKKNIINFNEFYIKKYFEDVMFSEHNFSLS